MMRHGHNVDTIATSYRAGHLSAVPPQPLPDNTFDNMISRPSPRNYFLCELLKRLRAQCSEPVCAEYTHNTPPSNYAVYNPPGNGK